MYSNTINSKNPTLFVFLVDTSGSMHDPWVSSSIGTSLSQSAAIALNEALYDLSLRACMKDDHVIDRVHIGAYAYGDDSVEWALPGLSEDQGWVNAETWVPGYSRVEKVPVSEDAGRVITREIPIWFEPEADGSTPMCTAFRKAAEVVRAHMQAYPDSFPPVVINITDGWPTDTGVPIVNVEDYSPDWGEVSRAAAEITSQSCTDGEPLLLNIHITPQALGDNLTLLFPAQAPAGSHDVVQSMVSISSVLPANFVLQGRKSGHDLKEGARGLILNADRTLLSDFLRIGTTLKTDTADDEQKLLPAPKV